MKELIEKGCLTYIAVILFLLELIAAPAAVVLTFVVAFSDAQAPPIWVVMLFELILACALTAPLASITAALTSLILCKSVVSKICCVAVLVCYVLPFFTPVCEFALHCVSSALSSFF